MTFNIQHGINGAHKYDLSSAVDAIAKINPDLVGVQELTRNHATYNCDDQPARIADGLSARTGRTWHFVYQQEWFTYNRTCVDSGRGDGVETEGLGFFAPEPIAPPIWMQAWNGRIGLLTPIRRGRDVPVVVTHLAHGAQGQADRMRQLDMLLPWIGAAGSGPRVFMGDFNFSPATPEYRRLRAEYRDAWEDAVAAGTARGTSDGITHKNSRIDFIFYSPSDAIELLWVETVDTRSLFGTEPSDHRPVVAAFAVKNR
jgi:endonuclease/exonuclease/phosphatase family metal-dependent hydrolase